MATIAEVRARRAKELAEAKRLQDIENARVTAEMLSYSQRMLENKLHGLGLDYVLLEGEAVALIEEFRVSCDEDVDGYEWIVQLEGKEARVCFTDGSRRMDYLLEAMDAAEIKAGWEEAQAELTASADAIVEMANEGRRDIERIAELEAKIAALETRIAALEDNTPAAIQARIDEAVCARLIAEWDAAHPPEGSES